MNVQTLVNLLLPIMEAHGKDVEIRIGDQIECGPYSHDKVGGVWTDRPDSGGVIQSVILCAEDSEWRDEADNGIPGEGDELPLLWKPTS